MKASVEHRAATDETLGHARLGTGSVRVRGLHDWLGDHANDEAVMPGLDGKAFTHVFADLRGYGHSIARSGVCTVGEVPADCLLLPAIGRYAGRDPPPCHRSFDGMDG